MTATNAPATEAATGTASGTTPGNNPRWYVLHVYSGFEGKVRESILEKAKKQGLEESFHEIIIPKEEVTEIKRGKRVAVERNVFPGYVMVKMNMSDDAWHLVKNTPKVTGFLGSGNKPQAISEGEAARLMQQLTAPEGGPARRTITFDIGEEVRITDGAFASMVGTVEEVDDEKGKLKASVSIFGRPTPVELDFSQVEKT
ncbi:MAG: transcription termination/antitermination factor NusG [Rhodospirillales bacterium]|nr:transcription termination/antitermination factor NusG [Alphaproteobacteria bacterium]MCB9986364.1 transcription termination/antitermination factor NusG [Rhodospirillales bacterium]USO07087.1 MAG: transcription termination/antitermination factor NusG [Rhodospirillales bacterium]